MSNDFNHKIWIKKDSDLHEKIKMKNVKHHSFDMIVASELNLGIIGAMAFETHHKSQDWAFFINNLIEQCHRIFQNKRVIIFLDNSALQRPSTVEKYVGPRIIYYLLL